MSIVIGYWSSDDNNETPDKLHRLLTKAVTDAGGSGATISPPCAAHSPLQPDSAKPRRLINFGIAVCGRHATLEVSGAHAPGGTTCAGLTATIAVSGAGTNADAWFGASGSQLVLGREVFGRATIFWTRTEDAVWFASRLGLLLPVVGNARVSVAGFYAYGCYSYVPAPLTPVKNIFAIPAGSETIWNSDAPEAPPQNHTLYEWREAAVQTIDEKEAAGSLHHLLEESVAAQLGRTRGEPVGVFLSGGLDSSLTAAMLVRAGARVRAYTLDFGKECFSEVPYAERVAGALGIPLTKIPVTTNSVRRMLAATAARLDSLYGDSVTIPLALLCEYARREVSVVFNGEGGDQLFAGWTNKPLIAASLYEHHTETPFAPATAAGEEVFVARYMRTFHRLHGHETGVYTQAVKREIEELDPLAPLARVLDPAYTRDLLHRLRRANLMLKGADNIQPRAASLGLSYGLDVRTLFCSRRLAEWTFGISGELWLRAGCEKYLLKRAVEDLLPSEVVWREKRGMGVPLTLWLTGKLHRWAKKQLHPSVLAREGLWQPDAPRRILDGELSGQVQGRRIGETLWLMIMWRAWCESILQPAAAPARESATTRPWFPLHAVRALKRRFS